MDQPMPEPRMPTGDTGSHKAGGAASPAPTVGATDIASVGPSISMRQLEHDHALVVVRGAICVEFLLSVRQHLRNLVDVGVRYIVVDLAEVTACPPADGRRARSGMSGAARTGGLAAIDRVSPVCGDRVGVSGCRGAVPHLPSGPHRIPESGLTRWPTTEQPAGTRTAWPQLLCTYTLTRLSGCSPAEFCDDDRQYFVEFGETLLAGQDDGKGVASRTPRAAARLLRQRLRHPPQRGPAGRTAVSTAGYVARHTTVPGSPERRVHRRTAASAYFPAAHHPAVRAAVSRHDVHLRTGQGGVGGLPA